MDADDLRAIKTFPLLVKYLRDQLDWPINSEDFDELTFDYTPEELGIDPRTAAKIKEIKQLRPLPGVKNQTWGIFFINFEPTRLPVVALRRILSHLVIKKRASSNKTERPAWHQHDLLFISSYGESDHRDITFAHFADDPTDASDLPILRVLGWDDEDSVLHLKNAHSELKAHLHWPGESGDATAWRKLWSGAFTLKHGYVAKTSKDLSIQMAALATRIRKRVNKALAIESATGPLTKQMEAFKSALIHDLTPDRFADMYAQTITYGLLSARVSRHSPDDNVGGLVAENIVDMVPVTNPFLRDLLANFLTVGGRKGKIDFDELGIHEVVQALREADMNAVLRDFDDRNPQEDPVIHFYELFLKQYDPKARMQRGVFYTPKPVVSYIVRSVHELLQTEFGLPDGLADTATWADLLKLHKDLKLPEIETVDPKTRKVSKKPLDPDSPFVQILDPATGTATFLVEVVDVIHKTMTAKWKKEGHGELWINQKWNEYVPKHLLPRLHGYELMMAPYAIAHMKIGLKLFETGYQFGSEERARIYLTNALDPAQNFSDTFESMAPALAHESKAVNEVKRHKRFTVVIGNPPYSVTSANSSPFIDSLMCDYKKHVRGEQGLVALSDDYLKFMRLSQEILRDASCGAWGMITNHGYLKGVIHRGVRAELLNQFDLLFVLDLHGDSNIGEAAPKGKCNENVFDIQQGVSISVAIIVAGREPRRKVQHGDLWGTRDEKYRELADGSKIRRDWKDLHPSSPSFFLFPFDGTNLKEYEAFPSLNNFMPVNSCGVKTHRDEILIDHDKKTLIERISDLASERNLEVLRGRYGITDTPHWKLKDAQAKIRLAEVPNFVRRVQYRPFDYRWIYYNPAIIEKGDSKYPTLRHMLESNLALLTARIQATGTFDAVLVSNTLVEMKTAESSRSCTIFPLFLTANDDSAQSTLNCHNIRPNFDPEILRSVAQGLGLRQDVGTGLPEGFTSYDIFRYIYSILHSPGYRSRYAPFLKTEFPRIPFPSSATRLRDLARLGEELVSLHLLESRRLEKPITAYIGPANPAMEKLNYSDSTVWLDKKKTRGFAGVPEAVWNFHIGGYQVCQKWLKDRKGRTLSAYDISHYQKIVVALNETIRLMKEIDEVIEKHGGWPGAFVTTPAE